MEKSYNQSCEFGLLSLAVVVSSPDIRSAAKGSNKSNTPCSTILPYMCLGSILSSSWPRHMGAAGFETVVVNLVVIWESTLIVTQFLSQVQDAR